MNIFFELYSSFLHNSPTTVDAFNNFIAILNACCVFHDFAVELILHLPNPNFLVNQNKLLLQLLLWRDTFKTVFFITVHPQSRPLVFLQLSEVLHLTVYLQLRILVQLQKVRISIEPGIYLQEKSIFLTQNLGLQLDLLKLLLERLSVPLA